MSRQLTSSMEQFAAAGNWSTAIEQFFRVDDGSLRVVVGAGGALPMNGKMVKIITT